MKKSFLLSLFGHMIIILLMVLDLSFGFKKTEPTPPVIMMVDLTKVKISNKTNLPQKSITQKKKAQSKPEPKLEDKKLPVSSKKNVTKSEKSIVKPKENLVKEAVPVKTKDDLVKQEKKVETSQKNNQKNMDLQSLLASVKKVRKAPTVRENPKVPSENEGLQGLTEGRMDQLLTISERDYLASELQKCWNIDAGVEHADEIIVQIKAWINKDGSVRDVKIMNSMPISSFKTVAESARRAIYICDHKGGDSPFRILAEKYADHYGDWKEISLRFNPLKGIN